MCDFCRRVLAGFRNPGIIVGNSGGVPAGLFPAKAIISPSHDNIIKDTVFLKWVVNIHNLSARKRTCYMALYEYMHAWTSYNQILYIEPPYCDFLPNLI